MGARVAVVGGGIAGLAIAYELRELANEWLQAPPLDTSGGAALERPNPTLVRTPVVLLQALRRCHARKRQRVREELQQVSDRNRRELQQWSERLQRTVAKGESHRVR